MSKKELEEWKKLLIDMEIVLEKIRERKNKNNIRDVVVEYLIE